MPIIQIPEERDKVYSAESDLSDFECLEWGLIFNKFGKIVFISLRILNYKNWYSVLKKGKVFMWQVHLII
jgi:hypothetical protein